MDAFNVTRTLKHGSITTLTIAKDADTAIKELGLKRFGAKNVKAQPATIAEIQQYIQTLDTIEIYDEFKKGELCINDVLKEQYTEVLQKRERKVG